MKRTFPSSRGKRGVALIMVLGMLAMLTLMAVGFSVFTRTENVTASNYRSGIRSRNLLQVALAQAIGRIENSMSGAVYQYPPWDVLLSSAGPTAPVTNKINLLNSEILNGFIPSGAFTISGTNTPASFVPVQNYLSAPTPPGFPGGDLLINLSSNTVGINVAAGGGQPGPPPFIPVYATNIAGGPLTWSPGQIYRALNRSEWTDFTYTSLEPGMTNLHEEVKSHFAFVIVNCSGLLDPSHAGGSARGLGLSPRELQLDILPDFGSPAAATNFYARRDQFTNTLGQYETLSEVSFHANGIKPQKAYSFHPYTRFTAMPPPPGGQIYLGGGLSTNANELLSPGIINSFKARVATWPNPPAAGWLYTNLIDYVDADFYPGNLNGTVAVNPACPSVEPVPMINEIQLNITNRFIAAGPNYVVMTTIRPTFELIYPFKVPPVAPGDFKFGWNAYFSSVNSAGGSTTNQLVTAAETTENVALYTPNIHKQKGPDPKVVITTVPTSPAPVWVEVTVKLNAWVSYNGIKVDSVTNIAITNGFLNTTWRSTVGVNPTITTNWDCVDPRMNHSVAWWRSTNPPTFGATNRATSNFWSRADPMAAASIPDRDTSMFVANQPLKSVGEIGNLFFGKPWETVRLYNHTNTPTGVTAAYHPVFRDFTLVTNAANYTRRGLVNINTKNPLVLKAAFTNMPLDYATAYGSTNNPNRLQGTNLDNVVNAIFLATNAFYTNTWDIGLVNWEAKLPNWVEMERESIMNFSLNLFGTRHTAYTIVLGAQITKDIEWTPADGTPLNLETVVSMQRAVAEVWRDPLPDSQNRYRWLLRSFTLLPND